MTGIELKIAEVLSDVLDDVPDDKLLAAAGHLVRRSGELWISAVERAPFPGERVLGRGAQGVVHAGVVFSDPGRDGKFTIRAEGHLVFAKDWMPCPGEGELE
jgi:hypothetical protein